MHRMSVVGIALCACVIAFIQVGLNAPGLAIAIQNPIASKILIIGGTLMVMGLWWMMSMGLEEGK
jgi:Flp pilus assembly protein TadB